ncbi:helix-turn-helix domain-containing protein [Moritella viscosa]|uniref:helix-turn-helix domain-containing protein n=1 Tax=Moritella viscosa TaxID=80854 RepID=UPI00094DAB46|nr:helix-turn-helix transcriptional regulator [Moritella viscosa]
MSFDKRLRSIIKSENVSQKVFAEEVGVSVRAIEKYVSGERVPTGNVLMKIVSHERYIKYTMWLLTGGTEEDSDQVSPKLSIQEKCGLVSDDSEKQT